MLRIAKVLAVALDLAAVAVAGGLWISPRSFHGDADPSQGRRDQKISHSYENS
jgi:hypothetical protein